MKEWAAMSGGEDGAAPAGGAGGESDGMAAEWEAMLGGGDGEG
ncbi:MAG TPA: flagellar motor switch protein FliM, partial [Rhodospirillaceae bacterium]|nr:flagellar motor switch protein FliM [Rhodospirillaceae bacterium]